MATQPDPQPAGGGAAFNAFMSFLAGRSAGGGQRVDPKDPPIYWGATTGGTTTRSQRGRQAVDGQFWTTAGGADITKTLSEAQLEFYRWEKDAQNEWGDFLLGLGLIDDDEARDYEVLKNAWLTVLDESTGFTAAGKKMTPWDVARWMAGPNGPGGGTGGSGGGSGFSLGRGGRKSFTGRKSRTDTSIDLSDPATAKAIVNRVLSDALGRAANDDELRKFVGTLHAAERSNPTKTTTLFDIEDDEVVSSSSTTSGGMTEAGKAQVLLDQAAQMPDYGAYQSARMVVDWLGQAISSPV